MKIYTKILKYGPKKLVNLKITHCGQEELTPFMPGWFNGKKLVLSHSQTKPMTRSALQEINFNTHTWFLKIEGEKKKKALDGAENLSNGTPGWLRW